MPDANTCTPETAKKARNKNHLNLDVTIEKRLFAWTNFWINFNNFATMQDFSFYFGVGFDHIISKDALDHILFILVLAAVYQLKDWKHVLILVTAFTIGHSVTLALSIFNIVRFPDAWVEFLIPCTIVLTALINLLKRSPASGKVNLNYYLAAFFGLIHGMGFANTLRFMLSRNQRIGWNLLGFNAGLEAGQILVVLLILCISFLFVELLKVNKREWVVFLSAGVFSLALKMALERIP
jgi:hypothetical protein